MPDHALRARRYRLALVALATTLVVASLPGCSSSGDGGTDPGPEPITTALRIVITATASPVRGVNADLRHATTLTVTTVQQGTAWTGSSCAENVQAGRSQLACVGNADLAAPFTAWTLSVTHAPDVEPLDAITSLTCTGADATGAAVAVTCDIT